MTKITVLALVTSLLATGSAFALETNSDQPPAVSADRSPAKPNCKAVTFTRSDVKGSTIALRFTDLGGGDLLAQITACNDGAADSGFVKAIAASTGGVQVSFKVTVGANGVGTGTLSLPVSYTRGFVDQVVCFRPATQDGAPTHQKYATAWAGTLPSTIDVAKLDSYDREAADRGCVNAMVAGK